MHEPRTWQVSQVISLFESFWVCRDPYDSKKPIGLISPFISLQLCAYFFSRMSPEKLHALQTSDFRPIANIRLLYKVFAYRFYIASTTSWNSNSLKLPSRKKNGRAFGNNKHPFGHGDRGWKHNLDCKSGLVRGFRPCALASSVGSSTWPRWFGTLHMVTANSGGHGKMGQEAELYNRSRCETKVCLEAKVFQRYIGVGSAWLERCAAFGQIISCCSWAQWIDSKCSWNGTRNQSSATASNTCDKGCCGQCTPSQS